MAGVSVFFAIISGIVAFICIMSRDGSESIFFWSAGSALFWLFVAGFFNNQAKQIELLREMKEQRDPPATHTTGSGTRTNK